MTIGFTHGSDFLDALLASLADAVYVVGPAGEVRFANPAAVELLGYDAEAELLGRPSHATIHSRRQDGSPFPEDECPLLKPRVTGETVRIELDWFVRRDGRLVPVGYASAPLETPAGRGAVVVFRDLTQRLRPAAGAAPRAAGRRRGPRLAGADRGRHRRRAAPDRPRPARRRATAAGARADGDRGG